jgi:PAS domain S-box-containing protein
MTSDRTLSAAEFRRRFRWLIFSTWSIPPVFGLGFTLLIGVLTPAQIVGILTTPLEPAYIFGWLAFANWFLPRQMRPLADWLDRLPGSSPQAALAAVRRFPLLFWATFLVYLAVAPASVIVAAELYAGFAATPMDWFRIELVALIVSIIVGLPIFFLVFDLFGQALGGFELRRPIVTVRTKVFLIGALVPLLIDTMLVQYYWTRTGYFTFETFGVWLALELLAIGGSLIFAHSFGQSLAPLQTLIGAPRPLPPPSVAALTAHSTDELGVLTGDYRRLLEDLRLHSEILELNNQLLRRTGGATGADAVFTTIVDLCRQAIRSDQAFLIVHDPATNELVGVARTGEGYRADGYFRLVLSDSALAAWVFNHRQTVAVEDATGDPRVSRQLCERFGMGASLATPLWLEGEARGVLMAVDRQPRRYGQREVGLIEALAGEAAHALHAQTLRDERARAEAERRAQAEQVRLLLDATEEGIYGVDREGHCTFINQAALRMLGYARAQDLLGQNLHERIHHTLPDGTSYPVERCRVRLATLAGETAHADDEVHWRADGTSFPVEYWSRPIVRDGELVGTVVSFVDVSERKRSQAQSERLGKALDESANEIYMFDAETLHFTQVNRGARENLGYSMEELRRLTPLDLKPQISPQQFDALTAPLRDGTRDQVSFDTVHRRKDGTLYPVEVRLHLSRAGRPPMFVAVILDTSERRAAEEALRQHRENLEELVRARTAELETVNRELEAFSYSVSHDLRAPLRAIDGFSQALIEDHGQGLGAEARVYLERVRAAVQRMGVLIDDLLELSRVSRAAMHVGDIDLSAMASGIVADHRVAEPQRQVDVVIAPGLVAAGDAGLLAVAFTNLLDNAWKYTGRTAHARIEVGSKAIDGERVFFVRDNGVGFDMQYAHKLFGAFQRLHSERDFPGTGVGLATVARIIQRHGGRVWAEGAPGQGAAFYFTLGRSGPAASAARGRDAPRPDR